MSEIINLVGGEPALLGKSMCEPDGCRNDMHCDPHEFDDGIVPILGHLPSLPVGSLMPTVAEVGGVRILSGGGLVP